MNDTTAMRKTVDYLLTEWREKLRRAYGVNKPEDWRPIELGETLRVGDVYEKDFVIGVSKTSIEPGIRCPDYIMMYMPRRRVMAA